MIDIRQLRYFVAVAEARHFTRAAEQLNVTQPPLSRQIAALENELGVTLLNRHSRKAVLTPAGEQFLSDSKIILATLDQALRNARLAAQGELGQLTIGFMMHAAHNSVPPLTRRLMAAHPQLQLRLRETLPSAMLEGVMSGELDAGITFSPGTVRGLSSIHLLTEPLCLAAPIDHRLAGLDMISPDMLTDEPLIASPEEITPTLRRAIVDYVQRAGAEPSFLLETQLQQTIISLVAEGIGVALVPSSLAKLGSEQIAFRPLADAPTVEQVLIWRSSNSNPALSHLLAAARK